MTFADIPVGTSIFVDANTFVYHYSRHPVLAAPCTDLLDRIARSELTGITSADVLSDVAHRLMVLEAATVFGWTGTGITGRFRRHPSEIQKLTQFQRSVQTIATFGIKIVAVSAPLVDAATTISRQVGLLSGDALIVTVMRSEGVSQLASHDADFDRVPGLVRYAPV
ncbi:MAG TPA: type II toxin-antitoxin system VapC family toxin [Pirellulales bacterium]|nr:type II toxin-antitoxin system VapC family toxin [Pirellulales bacterium]